MALYLKPLCKLDAIVLVRNVGVLDSSCNHIDFHAGVQVHLWIVIEAIKDSLFEQAISLVKQ